MVEIDGSMGEGGGQIVRTSLSMSVLTQRPVSLYNIRAGRSRPGLRPQHVTAVRAAAAISQAEVSTVEVGADHLEFVPATVDPGRYHFEIGTAGSAILVLQTILYPLLVTSAPSTVTVEGGTHVKNAPPYDFLERTVIPLLQRAGPVLRLRLDRHGFYPKGGGRSSIEIQPVKALDPLTLLERGPLTRRRARSIVANLPRHIAERELTTLEDTLPGGLDETQIDHPPSASAGNVLLLELIFEHLTTVVSGVGEKGLPAEEVAKGVATSAQEYLASDAPVGPHLADQLLLPLVMGGGHIRTVAPTAHTHTNAAVIDRFAEGHLSLEEREDGWHIEAQAMDLPDF